MKLLFLLSILVSMPLAAQTDTVKLVKRYNYHPVLANIQVGDIAYWKLCDSVGLYTREKCSILSFDMRYFGKNGITETKISGHTIPDSICTEIGVYGIGNMIFFTNIKAMTHDDYKILHLLPMNLTPVKRED